MYSVRRTLFFKEDGDDDDGGGYTTVFLFLGSFCCYFVPVNDYNIHFHMRRKRQKSFSTSFTDRQEKGTERDREIEGERDGDHDIFSYSTGFQVKGSDEAYSISVYLLKDLSVVSVVEKSMTVIMKLLL